MLDFKYNNSFIFQIDLDFRTKVQTIPFHQLLMY